MKKLFAIILSFGFIIAPMPVAYAGGEGYAKQILGISNGIVGSAILLKCKLGATQFSLPVYMAGGLIFVIAEVTGGKKKALDADAQAKKLDALKAGMVEGGDYQKAAIQAQIDDERSNLDFIQKRRKWMMAIKVVYTVATALAVMEMLLRYPPTFKPDLGGCGPDEISHSTATVMIASAYGALASSGSLGGMATGMAVGMAVKKFLPEVTLGASIADKAVAMLNPAEGRIAFFGASTALVFMIDSGLASEESKAQQRVADLEKLKASLPGASNAIVEGPSITDMAVTTAGSGSGQVGATATNQYALKNLPTGMELTKTCLSQTGTSIDASQTNCGTRPPVALVRPTFDPKFEVPSLKTGANTSIDFAQALANGDSAKADTEAGNLAAMAGKMDKIKDDLLKKANEKLAAEGKKPIDINAEVDRQVAALNNALNNANSGSGSSLADLQNAGKAKTSETNKASETNSSDIKTTTVSSAATDAKLDSGIDLSKIGQGEDGVIDPNAAAANAKKVATLDESLNHYESNESDISKDPGVSIFKQVSNRYFLNYTKIFQRKEITPPLEEPQINK
jgi:hypothetical protein